jgi:copper chaperone
METISLKVNGMTCQGCVRSVKNVLERVPGVSSAEVDLARGEARITFDPARATQAMLKVAIRDAGYETV